MILKLNQICGLRLLHKNTQTSRLDKKCGPNHRHCYRSRLLIQKENQTEKVKVGQVNSVSPICIPPTPGFHDLSSKSKFLAVSWNGSGLFGARGYS